LQRGYTLSLALAVAWLEVPVVAGGAGLLTLNTYTEGNWLNDPASDGDARGDWLGEGFTLGEVAAVVLKNGLRENLEEDRWAGRPGWFGGGPKWDPLGELGAARVALGGKTSFPQSEHPISGGGVVVLAMTVEALTGSTISSPLMIAAPTVLLEK
jgi:hypothetical protein